MNQAEKAELLEQLEEWNDADEFSRCIEAIEAIPEQERDYLLTVKLSRAYSNLAVLGDHGEHGTDSEVDGNLIQHAIRLLESVRTQGENDPYWNSRMGYSCLMAYSSAAIAYEYAKRWLSLAPDDPAAQKLVRDCEEYLEEEKALELDLKEREEIIRKETPDDVKKKGGVSVNEQRTDHSIFTRALVHCLGAHRGRDFVWSDPQLELALRPHWYAGCPPPQQRIPAGGVLSVGCSPDCGEYLGICAEIEIGGERL